MYLCVLHAYIERMTKELEKKVQFFIMLSSCENWVTLTNTINLRCNMPMLRSKLKKL